jgi:hypothetical protein
MCQLHYRLIQCLELLRNGLAPDDYSILKKCISFTIVTRVIMDFRVAVQAYLDPPSPSKPVGLVREEREKKKVSGPTLIP